MRVTRYITSAMIAMVLRWLDEAKHIYGHFARCILVKPIRVVIIIINSFVVVTVMRVALVITVLIILGCENDMLSKQLNWFISPARPFLRSSIVSSASRSLFSSSSGSVPRGTCTQCWGLRGIRERANEAHRFYTFESLFRFSWSAIGFTGTASDAVSLGSVVGMLATNSPGQRSR